MDLKETKEAIAALELLAVDGAKILSDGKVNVADIPVALDLLTKLNVFVEAVKNIKEVPDELKDLDEKEVIELGLCIYGLIKNVIAATKPIV